MLPIESVRGVTVIVGQVTTGGLNGPRTSVGALARLFAVFASGSAPTTVASLINAPGSTGRTTMVMTTRPPAAMVPRLQRTTAPPLHVPWLVATETNRVSAGRASATTTFVAASGPAFRTVSV